MVSLFSYLNCVARMKDCNGYPAVHFMHEEYECKA